MKVYATTLALGLLLAVASARPQSEYDDGDDEQYDENEITDFPKFKNEGKTIEAVPGETFKLKCEVSESPWILFVNVRGNYVGGR